MAREVGGRSVPYRFAPRRLGDPARLVASSARIRAETGWTPRLDDIRDIVRTAYAWREAHPHGFGDAPAGERAASASGASR